MGLLDWLGPVVNGTAQTVSAFGAADDARAKAKQNAVVQQIQMLRQQKEDALKQSLGQSTISKNNAEVGNYQSETKKRDFDMEHPKPQSIDPLSPQGVQAKQGLIDYEAKHGYHAPVFGSYEKVDSVDSTGQPIVSVLDKHTGQVTPTETKGKPSAAGKGGAGSAMDRRSKSYVDLMVHSYPQLQNLASQVRPLMITTAVKHPLANYALNQAEQSYLQAARDFLAGVLHQESGARLTDSQILFGMQRYLPLAGDSPQTVQDKLHAAQSVMEERRAEYGNVSPSGGGSGATQSSSDPVLDEFGITPVRKK